MTLRPFKITATNTKKKGEVYTIKTHRDEVVAKEIKLGKKAFEKLLYYPITAFGYDLTTYLQLKSDNINPKFDKKDVIKALDFWIEYFVYQNKCDYILENTVNKDFELHLEELIRVREAVLKDPTDTKYVRQKIRPQMKPKVEFTENVLDTTKKGNTSFSTVDQFCYKVHTITRNEYEVYKNTISTDNNLTSQQIRDLLRSRNVQSIDPVITNWIETRTYLIPSDMGQLIVGDAIDFHIDPGHITFASGEVGEELNPGDIITLNEYGKWEKVRK